MARLKSYLVWHLVSTRAIGISAEEVRRTYQARGFDVREVEEVNDDAVRAHQEREVTERIPRAFLHGYGDRSV